MTPEETKTRIEPLLALRESQIGLFTDTVLKVDKTSGQVGQASCVYINWENKIYALSCQHILKPNCIYYSGAKKVDVSATHFEAHNVPALNLVASNENLDLALFDLNGLDISSIPRSAYDILGVTFSRESVQKNLTCVSFIHGVPGFASSVIELSKGQVYMEAPIYSAYGPLVSVTDDVVVADFAEADLLEVDTKTYPQLKGFQASGGARDLRGMSGSGLWVPRATSFKLLGILLGRDPSTDPSSQHKIRFTPIWKVVEWLEKIVSELG